MKNLSFFIIGYFNFSVEIRKFLESIRKKTSHVHKCFIINHTTVLNDLKMFLTLKICRHSTFNFLYNTAVCKLSTNSNLELLSTDFTFNESYFHDEATQQTILNNIELRDMKNDFPHLFNNKLSTSQLAHELLNSYKKLPNHFHPIW